MANAERDDNYVTTILGVDENDLETPVNIAVNPVTGAVIIQLSFS